MSGTDFPGNKPSPFGPNTGTMPAYDAYAVVPQDAPTTYVGAPFRALYIGAAGNISLVTMQGNSVTFVGLTAGQILPVQGVRVNSTLTTATSIVGLI